MYGSNFFEQQESFRAAIRLGYDTNRTVIAPHLRLGDDVPRTSFIDLAIAYTPCITCVEIPWSSLYDLSPLEKEFGIRIVERAGHGWGKQETWLNGQVESIAHVEVGRARKQKWTEAVYQWIRTPRRMRRIHSLSELKALQEQIVYCGSLSGSSLRKDLSKSESQVLLHQEMMTRIMSRPRGIESIAQAADRIVDSLGGANNFSGLAIHMKEYVRHGKDNADISPKAYQKAVKELILEMYGNIPLNEAVSASMPIEGESTLQLVIAENIHVRDRKILLDACLDYRRKMDPQYPIFYLFSGVTDILVYDALSEFFPCTFSMQDMLDFRVIDDNWSDHPSLFLPILDILIASQGKFQHVSRYNLLSRPNSVLNRLLLL